MFSSPFPLFLDRSIHHTMLISLNWLNQYLNKKLSAEEAEIILTRIGLEVEGVEHFESIKGGLKGVVTGYVVEKTKHPDADRLSVTKVDVGTGELLQIVCGAPNVDAGQKVVVATVGTVLYPGGEKLEIKKSKIRGVESQGMICAEDELSLGDSHEGIMILPEDTEVGISAASLFQVESDTVLEINITPNRVDAASHIGCARDVAAFLHLSEPDVNLILPDISSFKTDEHTQKVKVFIENTKDCLRYSGLVITDISVAPSPVWLQNKLKSIGLKPINNIVDITNYVLHEIGQPLHAFDLSKITGEKIIVKNLPSGTEFVTLDDVSRKLNESDLMICNDDAPMCIAGVFGGKESGVSESTSAIFLESAYFNPVSIRQTSKSHGLHTDASFRFERGADPEITLYALKRAAQLIKEIAGGKISSDIIDVYPKPIHNTSIQFNLDQLDKISGQPIPENITRSILHSLSFKIINESDRILELKVPSFKVDVTREIDVIEEIMRIYGYDELIINHALSATFGSIQKDHNRKVTQTVADFLSDNGFYEILTNSLSHSLYYEKSEIWSMSELVELENPISSELDILRRSMLFSGLEVVRHNINHKNQNIKIFEIGKTYFKNLNAESTSPRDQYFEENFLAIWLTGYQSPEVWYEKQKETDYFTLKGAITSLLDKLRIAYQPVSALKTEDKSEFAESFAIYGFRDKKNPLVRFGILSSGILKQMDIKQPVWYAEVNWDMLIQSMSVKPSVYKEVPKFPVVRRDLALLVNNAVMYDALKEVALKTDNKILKEVNVFDVYEGKNIPEGKKSYALSFRFQDENKTLTDKEIDQVMEKLSLNFNEKLGAEVRS